MRISSRELSERMHVTASQIRQDLNCFGGFGQQGYGYNVKYLYNEISHILGVDKKYTAVIVGIGNLGKALVNNPLFDKRGVSIRGLFDNDPNVIGNAFGDLHVMPAFRMYDFCRDNAVDIAVLTLPKSEAFAVADKLAQAGVRGFWNFSNMELSLPQYPIVIENIHLGDTLMTLCYELTKQQQAIDTSIQQEQS